MQEDIKKQFPEWCINPKMKNELILTDDIDSLMCYMYQKRQFDLKCTGFLDVNFKKHKEGTGTQRLYSTKKLDLTKMIGLDFAAEGIKTWDNHVVMTNKNDNYNKESANLNAILKIHRDNYTSKAVISSFITMLSYYNIDITRWSKEQLCVLCATDGLYLPFNTHWESIARYNLKLLEYEFLVDFIKENLELIKKIESDLNLKNGKIFVSFKGNLLTNINLKKLSDIFGFKITLPEGTFKPYRDYTSKYVTCNKEEINQQLFNFALIYKDRAVVSY